MKKIPPPLLNGGLKSFNFFFNLNFVDYVRFSSSELFLDTHKVMKKISNLFRSPDHSLTGGWNCLIFLEIKVRRLQEILFHIINSVHPQNNIKKTNCIDLQNIP